MCQKSIKPRPLLCIGNTPLWLTVVSNSLSMVVSLWGNYELAYQQQAGIGTPLQRKENNALFDLTPSYVYITSYESFTYHICTSAAEKTLKSRHLGNECQQHRLACLLPYYLSDAKHTIAMLLPPNGEELWYVWGKLSLLKIARRGRNRTTIPSAVYRNINGSDHSNRGFGKLDLLHLSDLNKS